MSVYSRSKSVSEVMSYILKNIGESAVDLFNHGITFVIEMSFGGP